VSGWRAVDQPSSAPIPLTPSGDEGLLTLAFAPGAHTIIVTLPARMPEYAGAVLSAASLIALIALTLGVNRRRTGGGEIASDSRPGEVTRATQPAA
jgi:hypothetical protein